MTEPDYMLPGGVSSGQPLHYRRGKLTSAQRTEIRDRYADGETAKALAAEFGVSVTTVCAYTAPRDAW